MTLAEFSLAELINQLVQAGATIIGVVLAAWLAVKHTRWQIRSQRAFDRELDWLERAVLLVDEFTDIMWDLGVACSDDPPDKLFPNPGHKVQFQFEEAIRSASAIEQHFRVAEIYVDPDSTVMETQKFLAVVTVTRIGGQKAMQHFPKLADGATIMPGVRFERHPATLDQFHRTCKGLDHQFDHGFNAGKEFRSQLVSHIRTVLGVYRSVGH